MTSQNRDKDCDNIHFFKVILESTLRDGKMMIPRSFVKRYGEELLNPVMLKLPNGAKWEVHWTKCDHDDIYFEKGWENFAKHYSLSNGHFLVFRYEGGSQFQVLIFDGSALEIDYPTSNSSTHHAEGTNISHEDVEEIDDESPLPRKQKANPGAKRGRWVNGKIRSRNECNRDRRKKKAHEGNEGNKASERANMFKSNHPFFTRHLFQSYIGHYLVLPTTFSRKYMKGLEEGSATLVVCEGMNKTWRVRLKYSETNNRISINTGWMSIVQEYNLKQGDVCAFEMTHSHHTDFAFNVTIFRNT